ncbi:hypothetical protein EPUS_09370 [Endocarpon pusillum Z07020]|uniref:Uncharacterized protein n=1 Tax=Endocarpon pusillum (strain Z07020 / HMAS-L-300199) TaxID=1263415 RepID=U1GF09_ENDPU|nr:uncharacterized protein EPUS_09370 [Endocarpon pusillum Z07020]ERF70326.1 hypothetical protein EPUS_09370 [Endocarpon pusillum Z07020]
MALRFNRTDDTLFADMVDRLALTATNPLSDVQPSLLNLTSNCWALYDLLQLSQNPDHVDESTRFQTLSNDFGTALPLKLATTSLSSTYEYLITIQKLPSFPSVLITNLDYCNSTDQLRAPVRELDFTRNCRETALFWWHFVFGTDSLGEDAVATLFRNSLPPPFATMSNFTIQKLGLDAIIFRGDNDTERFRPPFQAMFERAAKACANDACISLDYKGNADIAGIGAIVAYGSIAAVSTYLALTTVYYHSTRKRSFGNAILEQITVEISLIFSDGIAWFGLMATLAGMIYMSGKAQSYYEYTLAALVSFLFANAGLLSLSIYIYHPEKLGNTVSVNIRTIPLLAMICLGLGFLGTALEENNKEEGRSAIVSNKIFNTTAGVNTFKDFIDTPCYADGFWPLEYLHGPRLMQLVIFIIASILAFLEMVDACARGRLWRASFNFIMPFGLRTIPMVALAGLWYDFATIVKVRARASASFGPSYEENTAGYGQIIASGLALQAVFNYLVKVIAYKLHIYSSSGAAQSPASEEIAETDEELQTLTDAEPVTDSADSHNRPV